MLPAPWACVESAKKRRYWQEGYGVLISTDRKIIRSSHHPVFYKSKPSKPLLIAMVVVFVVSLALPYSPLGSLLAFTRLPVTFLVAFAIITTLYLFASEMTKKFFYRRHRFDEI